MDADGTNVQQLTQEGGGNPDRALGVGTGDGSLNTNTLVQLTFTNGTSAAVEVFWVDNEGQEQPYYVIQAGTSYTQRTYPTHLWRFKQGGAGAGTIHGRVHPRAQETRLTEKSRWPQIRCGC